MDLRSLPKIELRPGALEHVGRGFVIAESSIEFIGIPVVNGHEGPGSGSAGESERQTFDSGGWLIAVGGRPRFINPAQTNEDVDDIRGWRKVWVIQENLALEFLAGRQMSQRGVQATKP